MESVYYSNLNCIEKYMPQLYHVLAVYENVVVNETLVVGADEINGRNVLYAGYGGEVMQLDSLYDLQPFLELWRQSLPELSRSRCVVFGLGTGIFLREILRKASADSWVCLYEPSLDILRFVVMTYDLTDLLSDPRLILVVPQMETAERTFGKMLIELLNFHDRERIHQTEYMNYSHLFENEENYFLEQVQIARDFVESEREFYLQLGENYVRNCLKITPELAFSGSITSLKGYMPDDLPAILIAGRTDIAENAQTLMDAKGHALLFAVDVAVDELLAYGITPDLYISVRPEKPDDILIDERRKKIPLVCSTHTDRDIICGHDEKIFFLGDQNLFHHRFFEKEEILLPMTQSDEVVCEAFSLLELLGVTNIIFVGDNTPLVGEEEKRTIADRNRYLAWIESELAKNPNLFLINTLGSFGKIYGAQEMHFDEAVAVYCTGECDVKSRIDRARLLFSEEIQDRFLDYVFVDYQKELLLVEEHVIESIQMYDELLMIEKEGMLGDERTRQIAMRIDEKEVVIEESPFFHYPECLSLQRIDELMSEETESEPGKEIKDFLKKQRERLSVFRQNTRNVGILVEEYKKDCKKRFLQLRELSKPTFEVTLFEECYLAIQELFDYANRKKHFQAFPFLMDEKMDVLQGKNEPEIFADRIEEEIRMQKEELIPQKLMVLVFLYEMMRDEKYMVTLEEMCEESIRLRDELKEKILQFSETEEELDPEDALLRFGAMMGVDFS